MGHLLPLTLTGPPGRAGLSPIFPMGFRAQTSRGSQAGLDGDAGSLWARRVWLLPPLPTTPHCPCEGHEV